MDCPIGFARNYKSEIFWYSRVASRLESVGEVNKVNISAYTFELVCDQFDCEYRSKLAAKGKGKIDMYFVLRKRVHVDENPTAKLT